MCKAGGERVAASNGPDTPREVSADEILNDVTAGTTSDYRSDSAALRHDGRDLWVLLEQSTCSHCGVDVPAQLPNLGVVCDHDQVPTPDVFGCQRTGVPRLLRVENKRLGCNVERSVWRFDQSEHEDRGVLELSTLSHESVRAVHCRSAHRRCVAESDSLTPSEDSSKFDTQRFGNQFGFLRNFLVQRCCKLWSDVT